MERDAILVEVKPGLRERIPPLTLAEFKPIRAAEPALRRLKEEGFLLIVTTSQPGLSRGNLSRRELDRMHELLRRVFPLDDLLVCPHDAVDHCSCRKPQPGLLLEAGFKWRLNLDGSFVVSDAWQDARAARLAGCTSLLVRSPWNGNVHRDLVLDDLGQIAAKIVQLTRPQLEYA